MTFRSLDGCYLEGDKEFQHSLSITAKHPKGTRARVLFSSVFGPYAQDDEFGSRKINPMELYHNQVTREQGPFSLRMFHRSWGILMIQQNISAPTTVIDFPTRERELKILRSRLPAVSQKLAEQVVEAIQKIRAIDLKKAPSISETLDWAQSLALLNADRLTPELVAATLNLVLKFEGDIEKVKAQLPHIASGA